MAGLAFKLTCVWSVVGHAHFFFCISLAWKTAFRLFPALRLLAFLISLSLCFPSFCFLPFSSLVLCCNLYTRPLPPKLPGSKYDFWNVAPHLTWRCWACGHRGPHPPTQMSHVPHFDPGRFREGGPHLPWKRALGCARLPQQLTCPADTHACPAQNHGARVQSTNTAGPSLPADTEHAAQEILREYVSLLFSWLPGSYVRFPKR